MDKKYQVFVSSTYDDLKEERLEVMKALLELNCIPCGMEYFPAADEDQWSYIKKLIDNCDYYVVIVGGCYGSEDSQGVSYTQKEYEYALSQGIPTIGFIISDREKLPAAKKDSDQTKIEKLEKFITLVKSKLCKSWMTPQELGGAVSRSLVQLKDSTPRIGWVRADKVSNEEILEELHKLRKENESLKTKVVQKEISEDKLDDTEKNILLFLSKNESAQVGYGDIRREFHMIHETKLLYYLEKLSRGQYMDNSRYRDHYYLLHPGRVYLVKNNLI